VDEALPRLRDHVSAVVDVVGSQRRRLPDAEGVVYHGQVPSVVPFYERAHAAIVPVLFGSGTRLKVVEAMALGRPVVSTTIGAEGLPVQPGVDFLGADDPASFAAALARIANQAANEPAALGRMLDRARTAATSLFWPRIVSRLVDTYQAELERRRPVVGSLP
jgi:glycosyltransferase involved in cell wall biosynthesis